MGSRQRTNGAPLKTILVIWICLFGFGCTNLFLHPTKILYIDPAKLKIKYNERYVDSFDGTKLTYWYFPSQNYEKLSQPALKTRALLLHFHGNAENMSSHFRGTMWPLLEGIDVMMFDYRSYGSSQGEKDIDGVYGDSLFMLKYAEKEAKKRNIPLIVFGQSLGGSLALKAIQDHKPENLKFVVIESAFYGYQMIAREKLAQGWLTFLFQPLAYVLVSDKYSPGSKKLGEIAPVPVVLMYSKNDPVVGYNHGEELFEQLNQPKEFWLHEHPGHINTLWVEKGKYKYQLIDKINSVIN